MKGLAHRFGDCCRARLIIARSARLACAAAVGLWMSRVPAASADTDTWSGGGGDMLWSDANNWQNGLPAGSDVVFGNGGAAMTGGTVTSLIDSSLTINSLSFNNSAESYQDVSMESGMMLSIAGALNVNTGDANAFLGGTGGTINAGSVNVNSGTLTVNAGATLNATSSFTIGSGGTGALVLMPNAGFEVGTSLLLGLNGGTGTLDLSKFTGPISIQGLNVGDDNGGTGYFTFGNATLNQLSVPVVNIDHGEVTVDSGATLQVTNQLLLAAKGTGTLTLMSNAGLQVLGGATIGGTLNSAAGSVVSGAGAVTLAAGTLNINGFWSVTGLTSINSGNATFNGAISGPFSLNGGATTFASGGTASITVNAGLATFASPSAATVFNNVSVTGGSAIVSGQLNVAQCFISGGATSVSPGGSLNAVSLSITGGTTTVQGGAGAIVVGNGPGSAALTMNAQTLTLNADATNPGTLVLDGNASFTNTSGTASIVTSAVGTGQTAGTVDLDGGVQTLTVAAGGTAAITARIVDGGFVKAGNGTLVLSNPANSLSGAITVQSGTLQLTAPSQITGGITVSFSGPNVGVLLVDSDAELGVPSSALTLAGGTFMASSSFATSRSIILGNPIGDGAFAVASGNTLTLNGPVSGTAGLVAAGPGTLELNTAMSTGQTQITGGILLLGPNGDLSKSYLVTIDSGATLDLGTQSRTVQALAGAGTVSLGSGTLTIADPRSANATIFSGTITGSGGVSRAGLGSLTLSGNNSFTGGLTATGGATLYLAGASSFTGGISASSGATVSASSDAALGDPSNGISLSNGELDATASFSTARPITISPAGGLIRVSAACSLLASGLLSGSGPATITGGGTLRITAAASLSGPVSITSGTLALSGSGSLASVPSFTLAAHSTLLLDDSTASGGNAGGSRLGSPTPATVSSGGGEVQLLGANSMASSESLGTLTLGSGQTTVSITDGAGSGSSASLAFAGLVRRPGADVNFEAADGSVLGGTDRITFLSYPYQPGPMPSWANVEEPNGTLVPAAYDPTLGVEPASAYVPPGGNGSQAGSVPEPAAAALLAFAASGLLWRRRQNQCLRVLR